jgi:ABC-type amino acid transport system permease subunit
MAAPVRQPADINTGGRRTGWQMPEDYIVGFPVLSFFIFGVGLLSDGRV